MKKSIGVIHCIAQCEDCGKEWSWYRNAQAVGAKHAKDKKHRVTGDIALGFVYDGRDTKPFTAKGGKEK